MEITELRYHKANARSKLNHAVKDGIIEKPESCPKCERTDVIIDAHHEDYDKPLEVIWLCRSCHIKTYHPVRKDVVKQR